jgi:hypothetical protein
MLWQMEFAVFSPPAPSGRRENRPPMRNSNSLYLGFLKILGKGGETFS